MNSSLGLIKDVRFNKIADSDSVLQFAVILSGTKIGADGNICLNCFIDNDIVIGVWVTIKNGVSLYDGIRIEDDVFIGPKVTFTNDIFPRSKQYPKDFPLTVVKTGASIGGGGNDSSGYSDLKQRHGWRGRSRYKVSARRSFANRQLGSYCAVRGGRL